MESRDEIYELNIFRNFQTLVFHQENRSNNLVRIFQTRNPQVSGWKFLQLLKTTYVTYPPSHNLICFLRKPQMLPKLSQRIRKSIQDIYITYSKSIYAIQTIAYILLSIQEKSDQDQTCKTTFTRSSLAHFFLHWGSSSKLS